MELLVLLAIVGGVWIAARAVPKKSAAQVSARKPRVTSHPTKRSREAYAEILQGGQYRDLTADGVAQLFAPFKANLAGYKRSANAAVKASEAALQTLKVNAARLNDWKVQLSDLKSDLKSLESLYDSLFFRDESGADRFYKIIDDYSGCEGDMETAIEEMEDILKNPQEYR